MTRQETLTTINNLLPQLPDKKLEAIISWLEQEEDDLEKQLYAKKIVYYDVNEFIKIYRECINNLITKLTQLIGFNALFISLSTHLPVKSSIGFGLKFSVMFCIVLSIIIAIAGVLPSPRWYVVKWSNKLEIKDEATFISETINERKDFLKALGKAISYASNTLTLSLLALGLAAILASANIVSGMVIG